MGTAELPEGTWCVFTGGSGPLPSKVGTPSPRTQPSPVQPVSLTSKPCRRRSFQRRKSTSASFLRVVPAARVGGARERGNVGTRSQALLPRGFRQAYACRVRGSRGYPRGRQAGAAHCPACPSRSLWVWSSGLQTREGPSSGAWGRLPTCPLPPLSWANPLVFPELGSRVLGTPGLSQRATRPGSVPSRSPAAAWSSPEGPRAEHRLAHSLWRVGAASLPPEARPFPECRTLGSCSELWESGSKPTPEPGRPHFWDGAVLAAVHAAVMPVPHLGSRPHPCPGAGPPRRAHPQQESGLTAPEGLAGIRTAAASTMQKPWVKISPAHEAVPCPVRLPPNIPLVLPGCKQSPYLDVAPREVTGPARKARHNSSH